MPLPEDHIRLIRVLARGSGGVIRSETLVLPLMKPQLKYDALSYAWGNPPANVRIQIDGQMVWIRKNLWRFLDQISDWHHDREDLLWIDSISINQSNPEEKAQQIAMMSQIFQQAQKIIAWLGPAYADSDDAITALEKYFGRASKKTKLTRFWSEAGGLALTRLCNRPYWTRLWVLQEIVLAKSIVLMCGDKHVAWDKFREAMSTIDAALLTTTTERPTETADADFFSGLAPDIIESRPQGDRRNGDIQTALKSPALAMAKRKASTSTRGDGLLSLMNATQSLDCTEPKDRVFALLAIANIDASMPIIADYKRPIRCLLNDVLRVHHQDHLPRRVEGVAAQCSQLAEIFGLDPDIIFELGSADGVAPFPWLRDLDDCPLGNPRPWGRAITFWWTICYGHEKVQPMLHSTHEPRMNVADRLSEAWEWAVLKMEFSAIRTLVLMGQIDAWRCYGVLFAACTVWNDEEMLEAILETGAVMKQNDTVFQGGAKANHASFFRQWLLSALTKRLGTSEEDEQDAMERQSLPASVEDCQKVAQMLLDRGADVNGDVWYYGSALQAAAGSEQDREAIVRLLLKNGADVKGQGGFYGTALQAASSSPRDNRSVMQLLLDHGAVVNARGGYYETALQAASASKRDHEGIVRLLIDSGADTNITGGHHGTALNAAIARRNVAVAKLLMVSGSDVNLQADLGDREFGIGVHLGADRGGSALYYASASDQEEIVQELLSRGADPNASAPYLRSPLHAAMESQNSTMVRLLCEVGAHTQDEVMMGTTALQYAAEHGYSEVVRELLDHGANVNADGSQFGSPLERAARRGHEEIVRLLLQRGAHVDLENGDYDSIDSYYEEPSEDTKANIRVILQEAAVSPVRT